VTPAGVMSAGGVSRPRYRHVRFSLPFFECHLFRAAIAGEGTSIDIRQL